MFFYVSANIFGTIYSGGGRTAAMSDGFRGRCAGTALFPHWISCKLWKLC